MTKEFIIRKIIPFTYERKMMSVIVSPADNEKTYWVFSKGADSVMLPLFAVPKSKLNEI